MAKVEIDEAELLSNKKLRDTVGKMLANKEARELVLKAHKVIDPNASIPELDAKAPVQEAVAEVNKKFDDFVKAQAEKDAKAEETRRMATLSANWNAGRKALKDQGYTDEGIAEVEKLMESKGIAEHADAAIIFERLHPPAEPVNTGSNGWDFFKTDDADKDGAADMKRLMDTRGEDEGILNKMISQTLTEGRGR